MIKTYLKAYANKTIEAKQINTETGEVLQYMLNNNISDITGIKFPFSFYRTTSAKMGYNSPAAMIKELKKRNQLGDEVQTDRQKAEEISALLELAKFRKDRNYNLFDIEDKLINIYGLSEEYTSKILRYITEHNIERHFIRVYTKDGDTFTTEINGTPADIEKYYSEKIEFIA